MRSVAAVLMSLALLSAEPWSVGIAVQLPTSPLQLERVASKWILELDYARSRPQQITNSDCATFVNHSGSSVTHVQIMFSAVDGEGIPKRRSLSFDMRETVKPGQSSSDFARCLSDGYANGDRGLWLVAWVNEVDFADGTSWHAPPEKDVVAYIALAVRDHSGQL